MTAAVSLINALVKKNPEEYKGCVSLAVSRLSRVSIGTFLSFFINIGKTCFKTFFQLILAFHR